jgi:hypothetical protein
MFNKWSTTESLEIREDGFHCVACLDRSFME